MQTRHFVFVFVGHQLVQIACHGFCHQVRRLVLHTLHKVGVTLGIGRVLVSAQPFAALLNDGIQMRLGLELHHLAGAHQWLNPGHVVGAPTAPQKRLQIRLDLHGIEFDGA